MLETIPGVPPGIEAIRAVGTVTAEDYAGVIEPMLDRAHREDRRLRVLLQLGEEYEGFTAGAVWEKTGAWVRHPGLWHEIEGYALVSDIHWMGELVSLAAVLLPFPMRVFGNDALDEAVAWLASLGPHEAPADVPQGAGASAAGGGR